MTKPVRNRQLSAAQPHPKKLPLLHRMEERAGERRDVVCPSPRSSPHSSVAGRGRTSRHLGFVQLRSEPLSAGHRDESIPCVLCPAVIADGGLPPWNANVDFLRAEFGPLPGPG